MFYFVSYGLSPISEAEVFQMKVKGRHFSREEINLCFSLAKMMAKKMRMILTACLINTLCCDGLIHCRFIVFTEWLCAW